MVELLNVNTNKQLIKLNIFRYSYGNLEIRAKI